MTDVLLLYLFTRVDVLVTVGIIGAVVTSVIGVAICVIHVSDYDEMYPHWRRLAAALAAFVALAVVVPDQKSLAIIVGGKVALDAARSPEAQEIGGLVLDAIRSTLKEPAK